MSALSIILASASPRRRQLLEQLGVDFIQQQQGIDESRHRGESPRDYVQRMAREKVEACLDGHEGDDKSLIIGADTAVVLDDLVLGKPQDESDAAAMLMLLSAREHQVMSALAMFSAGRWQQALSISRVSFRAISRQEAAAYCHTGEPMGKAGGYAIQGLAAIFVRQLSGSYSAVMGLPLYETAQLLHAFGVSCLPASKDL